MGLSSISTNKLTGDGCVAYVFGVVLQKGGQSRLEESICPYAFGFVRLVHADLEKIYPLS